MILTVDLNLKKREGKEALKRCWQRHNSNLYLPDTSYALLITELQLQKRVKSQSLVLFLLPNRESWESLQDELSQQAETDFI